MTDFKEILTGTPEELSRIFNAQEKGVQDVQQEARLTWWARYLRLKPEQLICAVGFNPRFQQLTETVKQLGYAPAALLNLRNEIFAHDIYKKLALENVLAIYNVVKDCPNTVQVMQYLLGNRIAKIEARIESTVNSTMIEKYKAEVRSIYMDGIASIDFAEDRLSKVDSGFRALLNEVALITESRLIPAGDIFFRANVLPEEKRKLLGKGLIPLELVVARLADHNLPHREKKMLQDYLHTHKQEQMDRSKP